MQGTPDLDLPALPAAEVWGKLLSINQAKSPSYDLRDYEVTIGRLPSNTIIINDNRLSGNHAKIKFDPTTLFAELTDLSTNGTYLGDQKIGKGNVLLLKNSDEIYLLHKTKVNISEVIGFAFTIVKQKQPEKIEKQVDKLEELSEDFHCPICDDVIYQAVTIMPCLHNFCGSCFSDWMQKQKNCPTCRKDADCVSKNPSINNIIEKYLEAHPEKKRPAEEYKTMSDNNKIKQDIINFRQQNGFAAQPALPPPVLLIAPRVDAPADPAPKGRGRGRGRGRGAVQQEVSDYSASSDSDTGKRTKECATCKKEINGFQCKRGQPHVACTNCKSNMPKLPVNNLQLPHICTLCERDFCSIYSKNCAALSVANINRRLKDCVVPPGLDIHTFRGNHIEMKITNDYMNGANITTRDLFKIMLDNYIANKLFRYIQGKQLSSDNSIKQVNLILEPDMPFCVQCFYQVWQQIVIRFRISVKDKLPNQYARRGNCYYGVNCKTMVHNQDHAMKLDHVCEQTKF